MEYRLRVGSGESGVWSVGVDTVEVQVGAVKCRVRSAKSRARSVESGV